MADPTWWKPPIFQHVQFKQLQNWPISWPILSSHPQCRSRARACCYFDGRSPLIDKIPQALAARPCAHRQSGLQRYRFSSSMAIMLCVHVPPRHIIIDVRSVAAFAAERG